MTVVLPSVSTAGSFRMIAFLFAIRLIPIAMVMVTTMGSPSGTAATEAATAILNISADRHAEKESKDGDCYSASQDKETDEMGELNDLLLQRGRGDREFPDPPGDL